MRFAIVSDIHGNLTALEAVIRDLKQTSPDLVIHGGDLAANGPRPAEVIDRIKELNWSGVVGNTDEMLWLPQKLQELQERMPSRHGLRKILFTEIAPATLELIGNERLSWLKGLPPLVRNENMVVLHASPNDLWRAPLATDDDATFMSTYGVLVSRLIVYGHIHNPFIRILDKMQIANCGSVSLSYSGDNRASYLLVDEGRCAIRLVEYAVKDEISLLNERKYPRAQWLGSILKTGRYTPPD